MNCGKAQREVSDLLDGEGGRSGPLGAHLDSCEACREFERLSVRVAEGYRHEVRSGIVALRRLERPRRRGRATLAAALLLIAIVGGLSLRELRPATTAASLPVKVEPPAVSRTDLGLPLTLVSDPPAPLPVDMDAPLSEWMRTLPIRLSDDPPAVPALSAEESS